MTRMRTPHPCHPHWGVVGGWGWGGWRWGVVGEQEGGQRQGGGQGGWEEGWGVGQQWQWQWGWQWRWVVGGLCIIYR